MKNILTFIIILICFNSCVKNNETTNSKSKKNHKNSIAFSESLLEIDPIIFLNSLASNPSKPCTVSPINSTIWINKKHLETIITLIESNESASPVVNIISSYYPFNKQSTIGNEAMFLIQGYIDGQYPPDLCSIYYFKGDINYYKKWWKNYNN